jgi:tRNA1Val (adenine37-N6)-methyltransferase
MANQFFRFKQFTVHQEACAMKVCTDACLQGAFTARYMLDHAIPVHRVLDIGAGTGLLSLMLAQQLREAEITGIELDEAAAGQASGNISAAPWGNRMKIIKGDAKELTLPHHYDLIITNPPFYEGDLKSPDQLRNQAMHTTTLNYQELLSVINIHLTPSGVFSVLLPFRPFADFQAQAAQMGFFAMKVMHVQQTVKHDRFRTIAIFSRQQQGYEEETISIKGEGNEYTSHFTALLQPYYLYL